VPNCKAMQSHLSPTAASYQDLHDVEEPVAVGVGIVVVVGIGAPMSLAIQ